jgi:hypothetical protein
METWALLLKEGGAIAALIVVLFIVKALRNGGKRNGKRSGEMDPDVWKSFIRQIVQEENERQMGDLRMLLEVRTGTLVKEIKEPMMKNLDDTRHDLRNAMQTAISSAHQLGKLERKD